MKDKNWTDIVSKQGDLRHFASMAIRKSGKSEHTSAQEIDFLFRIALSEEPLTPRQITNAMGGLCVRPPQLLHPHYRCRKR